jgi:hypothetical protein
VSIKVVPFEAPAPTATAAPSVSAGGFHVPLVGPDREDSAYLRATGYDLLEAGAGEGFMASLAKSFEEEGVVGPILSELKRRRAQGEATEVWTPYTALGLLERQQPKPVTPMAEEDWKGSPYARPGLSYTEGMTTEWAQMLAERHDTQAKRNDIIARASGWATIPGAFAGQLVDPIGLAANFVPIVSEARYAAMAARLGRYGARAATGFAEGAVGQAMLEPFVYQAAQGDQRDYDFTDALQNVALGGLFGAGAHTVLGGVGDLLRRKGVQAHVEAGDIAVRQAALGQEIDVRPALRQPEPVASMRQPAAAATEPLGFDVWHGSPHEFDRFSMEKLGTGEGAQAYGRGLYFAENEAVAVNYSKLPNRQRIDEINTRMSALAREMSKLEVPGQYGKYREPKGYELKAEYDQLMEEKGNPSGHLYKARIKADKEALLDWDMPLSEQSPKVQEALAKLDVGDAATGRELYEKLVEQQTRASMERGYVGGGAHAKEGEQAAPRLLHEAGIPGIKYLDAGSRDSAAGSRNIVIFDERLIDAVERNGVMVNAVPERGLGGSPKPPPGPVEDDYFFDPIDDVDMIDDPEALLAEAEEMAAGGRMDQAEVDQKAADAAKPPAKPGEAAKEAVKVDANDPVVKAERYGAAVKAMAACMAGVAA